MLKSLSNHVQIDRIDRKLGKSILAPSIDGFWQNLFLENTKKNKIEKSKLTSLVLIDNDFEFIYLRFQSLTSGT